MRTYITGSNNTFHCSPDN